MILSDWISNIRWKYFTNNKSGLIFKELMKEFRMVEQMTENCNDCKYEKECNHTEKYDYTYDKIMDYQTNKEYNSFKDICDLLNEQEETIQTQKDYIIRMGHGTIFEEMKRLKERNQRQCERLKEITDLMQNRDWEALEGIVEDWEQGEKQLEREWGTYGDAK